MAVKWNVMVAGVVGILVACADPSPTGLPLAEQAGLAKGGGGSGGGGGGGGGGSALYQARFVTGLSAVADGEITSDWFPAGGFSLSVNNPWRSVTFNNVTINLVNHTHGNWALGTCALANTSSAYNESNWDIVGQEPRTYAGAWTGSVTFSKGYLAFDGDRADGSPGGIHNVVTQSNAVIETADPNKVWFRQEVRSAGLKFGSASTPDGQPLLNPELACANYTIELRKMGS